MVHNLFRRGRKTTSVDRSRLDEQLHRFRSAMILCFAAASLVYALVLTASGHASHALLQRMASLGVALWLVGFLLMFGVGYFSLR
ncbi:MAG TPA: hypothetical protein VHL59_05445, partial [Thermoanaerobaculia bacterium]|nr:hypothetical protein [Thermoanaerobaculia bacterium]